MRRGIWIVLAAAGLLFGAAAQADAHGWGRSWGGFGRHYGGGFYRTRGVGFGVASYSTYHRPYHYASYRYHRPRYHHAYYHRPAYYRPVVSYGYSGWYPYYTAYPRVYVRPRIYSSYGVGYSGGSSVFVSPVVTTPAYYGGSTVYYSRTTVARPRITIGVSF